jgi:Fe-S cluster assembly scaffold protein SufB
LRTPTPPSNSTVQNCTPATRTARAASQLRRKRGICKGIARDHLTQVETGSGCPEVSELHPARHDSVGEFYSVAVTNNFQQADTGTKMITRPEHAHHCLEGTPAARAAPIAAQ